jgi:hypothetical protein
MNSFLNLQDIYIENKNKEGYFGTNLYLSHKYDINKIKQYDKYRYYNLINGFKNDTNKEIIVVNEPTIRYELYTHNIAHFIYDIFLLFFNHIQYNHQKYVNIFINVKNSYIDNVPYPEKQNINDKGEYCLISSYWCNSVFLSSVHDLNLNIINQDNNKIYFFKNLTIFGEDRRLVEPKNIPILCNKIYKYIDIDVGVDVKKKFDVILYTRYDSKRRILLNYKELENKLIKLNYRVKILHSLTNLSFKEQIQLLNNCKVFISPTGANLTNLLFMDKNIVIIEIDNRNSWPIMFKTCQLFKNYHTPNFKIIKNINRGGIHGSIQSNPTYDDNIIVNIDQVINYITHITPY